MLIAAVDAGGSKTVAVLSNDKGEIIGQGHSGCGNHQVCGINEAHQNVVAALFAALHQAGTTKQALSFVEFSLAGADGPRDEALLGPRLASLQLTDWHLTSDAWSALRLGTTDGVGVSVVCGSGTNCVGQAQNGKRVQIGGFGYLFGDVAGGMELARAAFHHAVRSFEKREPRTLLEKLLPEYFGCSTMKTLIAKALDENWTGVPMDLAILVHEAAGHGDAVAQDILAQMGRELGLAAVTAVRQLTNPTSDETEQEIVLPRDLLVDAHSVIPIVLTGSILQKGRSPFLFKAMQQVLSEHQVSAELRLPRQEPVYGGLLLAADATGVDIKDSDYDCVQTDGSIME